MTEYAWFAALCDDDYEFLGVPDPSLQSSWEHCRDIVLRAERNGFDNVLLPSGYALGIDATAFASAIAVETNRIKLLLAVRLGELVVPQLARQIATLQHIAGGRLVINAISSDVPGETLVIQQLQQRCERFGIAVVRSCCEEQAMLKVRADRANETCALTLQRIVRSGSGGDVVRFVDDQ